jgi:ribosome small subunit-dependent GTPase A
MIIKTGKIIKQISNDYTVLIESESLVCKARGKFRNLAITPLVGDIVEIDYDNKYILDVKKRRNELVRPRIANIDIAVIVTSIQIPEFSTNLLDKLLVNIEFNSIEPIICITKIDIVTKEKLEEIDEYIEYYKKIGYKVYKNNDSNIKEIFKDKITVFAGQTGAGKSTLLNMLDTSLNIETGEVSVALGRGKHTTRHTELIQVNGGYIADTPGFSSIAFDGMTNQDIRDNFIEFNEYRDKCKYKDCMHQDEDDCEIKRQVEIGDIIRSRYENYLKFIEKR